MNVNDVERLIATAQHSGNAFIDCGIVTGTTITFKHKFVSLWMVMLTPWAAAGGATCGGVSWNQDEDGFYTTATIESVGCDFIGWIAIGTGISA